MKITSKNKLPYPYNFVADIMCCFYGDTMSRAAESGSMENMGSFPDDIEQRVENVLNLAQEGRKKNIIFDWYCTDEFNRYSYAQLADKYNTSEIVIRDTITRTNLFIIANNAREYLINKDGNYDLDYTDHLIGKSISVPRVVTHLSNKDIHTVEDLREYIKTNNIKSIKELSDGFRCIGEKSARVLNRTFTLGLFDVEDKINVLDREDKYIADLMDACEQFVDNYARNDTTEEEMLTTICELKSAIKLIEKKM